MGNLYILLANLEWHWLSGYTAILVISFEHTEPPGIRAALVLIQLELEFFLIVVSTTIYGGIHGDEEEFQSTAEGCHSEEAPARRCGAI
jgi:hypothetical protein